MTMEFRRFKIKNEPTRERLESLIEEKDLSREDLILILSAIEINQEAFYDDVEEVAKRDFKHPNLLDEEDISEVLELSSRLVKWSELVKAYALDQAKMGVKFPGYKLVEGRASRRFTADDETILCTLAKSHLCEADAMVHKLRTVADMEKVYGKAAFDEVLGSYVVKDAGAPTLVPITDKRPEINSNEAAADDFKDIIA